MAVIASVWENNVVAHRAMKASTIIIFDMAAGDARRVLDLGRKPWPQ
jgi:hypothetical protein